MKSERIVCILKGVGISIIFSIITLIIYAIILTNTNVSEKTIPVITVTITAISLFLGSFISNIKMSRDGVINGGIVAIIYIGIIYVISSLISKNFSFSFNSILMCLFGIIGGGIGGIIGVNKKDRK